MSIIAILLMAALTVVYVGYPLWARGKVKGRTVSPVMTIAPSGPSREFSDVEELELDETAGRVEAEDYSPLLESYEGTKSVSKPKEPDDEIERQVKALRQKRAGQQTDQASSAASRIQKRPTQKK